MDYSELNRNAHQQFGRIVRDLCEVSGFPQGKLAREAKAEKKRLIAQGSIHPGDVASSMEQPTISRVLAGLQEPTYFQVLIWLHVLRKHYESEELARMCEERGVVRPAFPVETERLLWTLAGFVPPEARARAYAHSKEMMHLLGPYPSLIAHKERRMSAK